MLFRSKIFAAVEQLGYVPSRGASTLKSGTSCIIGCYAADITESFANLIVRGVERGLSGTPYSMLFVSGMEFENNFSKALKFLLSYKMDGLLLCYPLPVLQEITTGLKNVNVPVISVNSELSGIKSIIPDNVSGGKIAAEHLYDCGMRHPAMISGPETRLSSLRRMEGFSFRLKELGIQLLKDQICFGSFSYENGFNSAEKLISSFPEIDGIFCANDYIAAGAIACLEKNGRKVPADVKILGFDNRDFSSFWQVPISTFEQPLELMGKTASETLCRCIASKEPLEPNIQLLQSKLIVRKSTDCNSV